MRSTVMIVLAAVMLSGHLAVAEDVDSKQLRTWKKSVQLLAKGGRMGALEELVEEMAKVEAPEVAELILAAGTAVPSERLYRTAGKAITRIKDPAAIQAVIELLEEKKLSYVRKVLILEALGRRKDEPSFQAAMTRLDDPIVHVQLAAIDAVRRHRRKEAIPALIELFEKHSPYRDRTWYDARRALVYLTGQEYDKIEDWRKFWDGAGASFDPKDVGKKKPSKGGTVVIRKVSESVDFFGIEIFSRNVVFVVDTSGSMSMYDEGDDYDGNDAERDRERLYRAKSQLAAALRKLPRGARFNVVAFSDKVINWQKALQPATKGSVASAIKWVSQIKANGATHTDDALVRAFEDIRADTIVLLSDGAPMKRGKGTREDPSSGLIRGILSWVKDTNAGRRVRIDTLGFVGQGEWPTGSKYARQPPSKPEQLKQFEKFLRDLAKATDGRFRAVD